MFQFSPEQLSELGSSVGTACACFALLGFIYAFLVDVSKKDKAKHDPFEYIQRSGSAAGIPPALMLVFGAVFQPAVIPQIAGLKWPIAVAGALFLYMSLKGVFTR